MGDNDNKSVVVGLFSGADKAEIAANQLKAWDKADDSIALGAIQILTSSRGKVENRSVAPSQAGGGSTWGAIVGAIAAVFSAGLSLIGGLVGGGAAGGVLGSLKKTGLKISDEELKSVEMWLKDGKAAMVVICDES